MARLDKKAMEQRDAEIGELREDLETLEKDNMDLTYQSLEANKNPKKILRNKTTLFSSGFL